jgi:hypothetical protein
MRASEISSRILRQRLSRTSSVLTGEPLRMEIDATCSAEERVYRRLVLTARAREAYRTGDLPIQ